MDVIHILNFPFLSFSRYRTAPQHGGRNIRVFLARVGPILGCLLVIYADTRELREIGQRWMNHGLLRQVRESNPKAICNLKEFEDIKKYSPPPYFYAETRIQTATQQSQGSHALVLTSPKQIQHACSHTSHESSYLYSGLNSWGDEVWHDVLEYEVCKQSDDKPGQNKKSMKY